MGGLRREYPILFPDQKPNTSVLTAGPPRGEDYPKSGEALFDLLWRRVSAQTIPEALRIIQRDHPHESSGVTQLLNAAKKHREPCPDPKPKPEGEMVVKVLIAYGDSPSSTALYELGCQLCPSEVSKTVVGAYRVPVQCFPGPGGIPEALAAIRDAGGECLAGEPLPERVEETWRKVQNRFGCFHCEACGGSVFCSSAQCHDCKVKLDGVLEWDPNAYRNKGC